MAFLAVAALLLAAMHGHVGAERDCDSTAPTAHCAVCDALLGGAPPAPAPMVAHAERVHPAEPATPERPVLPERREPSGSRAPPHAGQAL